MTTTNFTAPERQDGDDSSMRRSLTRKRRSSTYKKRPAGLDRYTCDMNLNIVARKVEVAKANNGGVLKYKAMTDIIKSMQPTLPWLTKEILRNHINKMKRDAERSPPDEDITAANATSTLSSLTLAGIGILNSKNTVTGTASMGGGTSGGEDNIAGGRP